MADSQYSFKDDGDNYDVNFNDNSDKKDYSPQSIKTILIDGQNNDNLSLNNSSFTIGQVYSGKSNHVRNQNLESTLGKILQKLIHNQCFSNSLQLQQHHLLEIGKSYIDLMVRKICYVKVGCTSLYHQLKDAYHLCETIIHSSLPKQKYLDQIDFNRLKQLLIMKLGKNSVDRQYLQLEKIQDQIEDIIKKQLVNKSFKDHPTQIDIKNDTLISEVKPTDDSLFKKANNIVIDDCNSDDQSDSLSVQFKKQQNEFKKKKSDKFAECKFITNTQNKQNNNLDNKIYTKNKPQYHQNYANLYPNYYQTYQPYLQYYYYSYPNHNLQQNYLQTYYNYPYSQNQAISSNTSSFLQQTNSIIHPQSLGQKKISQNTQLKNQIEIYLNSLLSPKSQINLFCQQMSVNYVDFMRKYDRKIYYIKASLKFVCTYLNNAQLLFESTSNNSNLKVACNDAALQILRSVYNGIPQMWKDFVAKKRKKGLQT